MTRTQAGRPLSTLGIGLLAMVLAGGGLAAMEADAKDGVNGALSAIELKSRAALDEALEAAQSFIDEQSENASAALEKTAELRDAAADSLMETIKARPLATLAAVVGVGFLAGFLCRRA